MYTVTTKIHFTDDDGYEALIREDWFKTRYSTFKKAIAAIMNKERNSEEWKKYPIRIPSIKKTANGYKLSFHYIPTNIDEMIERRIIFSIHDMWEWSEDPYLCNSNYSCYEIVDMETLPLDEELPPYK